MADQHDQPASVPEPTPGRHLSGGYLKLGAILDAQHPLAPPELGAQVHAAEHFFIVVHQAFELWFKQELLDLRCAAEALTPPSPTLSWPWIISSGSRRSSGC